MKKLISIAPLLVVVAAAQVPDDVRMRAMQKAEAAVDQAMQMKIQAIGAVKGVTVKGAPYSGEEINETNQVLADGTRIHRETRAMVYRDSDGRTRRETPDNITINDPVAGVSYILNPKTMTGQKLMTMSHFSFVRKEDVAGGGGSGTSTFTMKMESDGGAPKITLNGEPLDEQKVQELMARAKADPEHMTIVTESGSTTHVMPKGVAVGAMATTLKRTPGESIGKQTIEGVTAEGTRSVNTIKAGSIGNDRDIQVIGESWYSSELQMTIQSKHSDPRTGDESFRVININRNEPAAYLFQVPSGYNMNNNEKRF
jgi:hypothetical protein